MKKLKDCEEPLERMMASFAHFGDSLGPVLYQLPPHFTLDLPRLEDFLRIAPRHPVPVFEFRHPSWYVDEVYALLDRHGRSEERSVGKGCVSTSKSRWMADQ